MSSTKHGRWSAAHKSRKSHVRSRAKKRLGIDWEDGHTTRVQNAIKDRRPFVKHVMDSESDDRKIFLVKLFGVEFYAVVNKSYQLVTVLSVGMAYFGTSEAEEYEN